CPATVPHRRLLPAHLHVTPCLFFFPDPATPEIYTLSLHDALPIWGRPSAAATRSRTVSAPGAVRGAPKASGPGAGTGTDRLRCRSEEHTSELQSRENLVCRLLLEKKNKNSCDEDAPRGDNVGHGRL